MRLENESPLRAELRGIAEDCLSRLRELLADGELPAKELTAVAKETRALCELVGELDPAPPVQEFKLILEIEGDS